jgi:hypothetical protein
MLNSEGVTEMKNKFQSIPIQTNTLAYSIPNCICYPFGVLEQTYLSTKIISALQAFIYF